MSDTDMSAPIIAAIVLGLAKVIGEFTKRFSTEYETEQRKARAEADKSLWDNLNALQERTSRMAEKQAADNQALREEIDRLRADSTRTATERDDERGRADRAEQERDGERERADQAEQREAHLLAEVDELKKRVAALESHVAELERRGLADDTGESAA